MEYTPLLKMEGHRQPGGHLMAVSPDLHHHGSVSLAALTGRSSFLRPGIEHDQEIAHNFGRIMALPALIIPGAGLDTAFDEDFTAFFQVVLACFRLSCRT